MGAAQLAPCVPRRDGISMYGTRAEHLMELSGGMKCRLIDLERAASDVTKYLRSLLKLGRVHIPVMPLRAATEGLGQGHMERTPTSGVLR